MILNPADPAFKPKISKKINLSPSFQDNLHFGLNKEGDTDPWNDYIPDELDLNDENKDPSNYELSSQRYINPKKKQSTSKKEAKELQPPKSTSKSINSTEFIPNPASNRNKGQTFENAYNEMAKKILHQQVINPAEIENHFKIEDLLLGPSQIQELEVKSQKAERVRIGNFVKKLEDQAYQSQEAKKNLKEETIMNEMKECTFHPKIKSQDERRGIQEFLEGQRNFMEKLETKKQIMKINTEKKLQEEARGRPEINQNSKKMASSKNVNLGLNVHERLYNLKHQGMSKMDDSNLLGPTISNEKFQEITFTPIIQTKSKNMVRGEKVEDILYKDAIRRNEKMKSQALPQPRLTKKSVVNLTSEKIIIQKFIKEFELTVAKLFKSTSNEGEDIDFLLDYISCGELLKNLGFLSMKENLESVHFNQERTLLYDLWIILRGDQYNGVSKRNLCMFLLSVQGLYWNIENLHSESGKCFALPDEKSKNIGVFNERGEWETNEAESKYLHMEYDLFYRNRLTSETLKKSKTHFEPKFAPEISETSKVLAEHYRERLLEEFAHLINNNVLDIKIPENGALTHTDLLVLQKKTQLLQHEKRNREKEEEEKAIFSFQPKTNSFKPKRNENEEEIGGDSNKSRSISTSSRPRYLELYSMAKTKNSKNDRDPKEIEFEKNSDECTFMPDLKSTKNKANNNNNKDYFAKNIDKTVDRIRMARKEREYVKVWTERGIPKSSELRRDLNGSKMMSASRITYQPENGENEVNQENYENPENHDDDGMESIEKGSVEMNDMDNSLENKIPLLYVDVNLGANRTERIVVYEGDESEELAERFVQEHGLDKNMKYKLKDLLDAQIAGVLTRIEEERASLNSDSDINHKI